MARRGNDVWALSVLDPVRLIAVVDFLRDCGEALQLSQTTIATAASFLHRFFRPRSCETPPGAFDAYAVAATCLFIAGKVPPPPPLLRRSRARF